MKKKLPTPQQLPSGSWRCQVTVDGKRVSVIAETPQEAQAKAVAVKAGLIEEKKTKKGKMTLDEAITKYIEDRRAVFSPATIKGYDSIRRNRFPALMKMDVLDIDKQDLQRAISDDAPHCSYKTLKNSVGLVYSVISQYKEISTRGLKYPQKVKKEHAYLDTAQIVALIEAAQGDSAEVPILLAVWLGLRQSEIFGLHWDAIDFANKKISIERAVVQDEHNQFVEKQETKNASSRRVLSCPDYILNKIRQMQPEKDLRIGSVFTMYPSSLYKHLKKISAAAGIPFVGVHGLRHTNASVMLSLGIVDKVAMQRGGWSTDVTMKRVYQHVFSADKATADDVINDYFDRLVRGNAG